MSVGFAGARGLDDRRRRRLAQNADTAERRAPARRSVATTAAGPQFASSPIESLVRPQLWVNLLLATLGLSLCGGTVYLGEWVPQNYPSANASFGPHGLLERALATVCLVFSAQLAAAIHWYRARSRKDFNGRYRIWHFIVPSLLILGFCTATDCHRVLAEWAQNRWQLSGPYAQTLLWMVPTGSVLLAMVRLLQTEMRGTGGAAPSLWMVVLAAIVHAAIALEAPVPVDDGVMDAAGRSAMLLWPLGLLLALLFYTRRVIYVSNEPSALPADAGQEAADEARHWRNWWRPRKESRRAADVEAEVKQATAGTDGDRKRARKRKPAEVPANKAAVEASWAPAAPAVSQESVTETTPEARSSTAARPVDSPVRRSDEAHSADDLDGDDADDAYRGLSKKQRRKLRRQQQRERRNAAL